MIKVKILTEKKKKEVDDLSMYSDDIERAKKDDEKEYKKQLKKSEKVLRTGKLNETDDVEDIMKVAFDLTEIEEICKVLDLRRLCKYISTEGSNVNPKILSKINNTKTLRSIENLMQNGADFNIAVKIISEDDIFGI